MTKALLIYNARILDENIDSPGAILVLEGKIRSVFQGYFTDKKTVESLAKAVLQDDGLDSDVNLEYLDAKGLTATPAFIDMHVHFRDPGLTQKEDLHSGLQAAVAGGYGTVVCMPNTSPVISSYKAAMDVVNRGKAFGLANIYQSVSITENFEGKSVEHLKDLNREDVPLITEDGHEVTSSSVMLAGMKIAGEKNIIVSCHCEDPELAASARPLRQKALKLMEEYKLPAWGGSQTDISSIPSNIIEEIDSSLTEANTLLQMAEDICTERNIHLAHQAGCHVHMCHVSTVGSIEAIRRAKEELTNEAADFYTDMADAAYEAGIEGRDFKPVAAQEHGFSVTCEVTPHHIALTGTEEPNIRALVNPPLRSEEDRLFIIDAIRDGTVDCIATDHAPHTLEDKAKGAPGFTGIEASYGICNKVLVKEGQISPRRLSQIMSANPARILKLNKGQLKPGYDADITIVNPEQHWTVDSKNFYSKGKATPFEGKDLVGKVQAVYIAGQKVFEL